MKYNDLSLGTIEAIVNKLGGMEGVKRFLSDSNFIIKIGAKIRRAWITLNTANTENNPDILIGDIQNRYHAEISQGVRSVIDQTISDLSTSPDEINLVSCYVKDLGFDGDATLMEVCIKARELGLELLPNKFSLQLCLILLMHNVQFSLDLHCLVMEPLPGSDTPHVLVFNGTEKYGKCHIDSHLANRTGSEDMQTYLWDRYTIFHFCIREQVIVL